MPGAPQDPSELVRQAIALAKLDNVAQAIQHARRAARLSPAWEVLGPFATALHDSGRIEEAVRFLEALQDDLAEPPSDSWNALGCCRLELGDAAAAVGLLRRAIAAAPRPALLGNLAAALRAAGEQDGAAREAVRAAGQDREDLRLERLALLLEHTEGTGGFPPPKAGADGQLVPLLSVDGGRVLDGLGVTLDAVQGDLWVLLSSPWLPLMPQVFPGAPLLGAVVWNPAGLFLKEGRVEAVTQAGGGRIRISLAGGAPRRVQRRRSVRILPSEDFISVEIAEGAAGEGAMTRPVEVGNLSAHGVCYLTPGNPPPAGTRHLFRVACGKDRVEVAGIVRSVRRSREGKALVAAEFDADGRVTDRIARFVQGMQVRLRARRRG